MYFSGSINRQLRDKAFIYLNVGSGFFLLRYSLSFQFEYIFEVLTTCHIVVMSQTIFDDNDKNRVRFITKSKIKVHERNVVLAVP